MSADSLEQITELFLQCLQAGVYVSSYQNMKESFGLHMSDVLQHALTPEDVKKQDSLYAQLITNYCGLLHYSNLLNSLNTLGQHYYILTWAALLERVTKDNDRLSSSPLPDIIRDLDFTRSQRVSFLYRKVTAGNMKKFVTAAANVENPAVIFDVIFLLNYNAAKSLEVGCINSKPQPQKFLLQYMIESSQHKNLVRLYLNYWSSCPELQYDILNALLNTTGSSSFLCTCGMPLPCKRPVSLEYLAETILDHGVLDAQNRSELCQRLGYWKGYCTIATACNLQSASPCLPFILQNCDLQLLDDIMEVLIPEEYKMVFDTLACITASDSSVMKCFRCCTTLTFPEQNAVCPENNQTNLTINFK